jgi:hypothetical protein
MNPEITQLSFKKELLEKIKLQKLLLSLKPPEKVVYFLQKRFVYDMEEQAELFNHKGVRAVSHILKTGRGTCVTTAQLVKAALTDYEVVLWRLYCVPKGHVIAVVKQKDGLYIVGDSRAIARKLPAIVGPFETIELLQEYYNAFHHHNVEWKILNFEIYE